MKKALAPSEIEGYKKFIKQYTDFSKDIVKYQEGLERLEEEKNNLTKSIIILTDQVDKVRLEEEAYNDKLIAKYGAFTLNLETFEITMEEE